MPTIEVVHVNSTRPRYKSTATQLIPISISARHVHLTQAHFEALFGLGRKMTIRTHLTQPGQFACNEQLTLVGPRNTIERVRILGPARLESQVEVSKTDALRLGLDVPVRASGDTAGSPGATLIGPCGRVELSQGVICAARHIHMSPDDALRFGVKDKDVVGVRVESPARTLVFENVLVRVHPDFQLDMHIDTDESNSADIGVGASGRIV